MTTPPAPPPTPSLRPVVLYTRLSKDKHGDGLAVDRQRTECEEYATRNGLAIVGEYSDASASATHGIRPQFEQMLADLEAMPPLHRPGILAWAHDRIARQVVDGQRVLALGVDEFTVIDGVTEASSPSGVFTAEIRTSVAALEGRIRTERQLAKHRQRRRAGQPFWGRLRPFGYYSDGEQNPREALAVADAYRTLDQGGTFAAIARQWNAEGLTTTTGKAWTASKVNGVLRHPRYAGFSVKPAKVDALGREVEPAVEWVGAWQPVLPREEWERILDGATSRNLSGRSQGKRRGLLSGIVECGAPGCAGLVVEGHTVRPSRAQLTVSSRGVPLYRLMPCLHTTAPVEEVDAAVVNALLYRLADENVRRGLGKDEAASDAITALREELRQAQGIIEEADKAFRMGLMSAASYGANTADARVRVDSVQARIAALARPDMPWVGMGYRDLIAWWYREDVDATLRRSLIQDALPRILLVPRGVRLPNSERVFQPHRDLRFEDENGNDLHLGLAAAGAVVRGPGDTGLASPGGPVPTRPKGSGEGMTDEEVAAALANVHEEPDPDDPDVYGPA